MSVTVLTRWSTPNVDKSTQIAKRSKAVWMKHGAASVRLRQIFTGPYTGQFYFVVDFADMAAYAKASAKVRNDMAKLVTANTKIGAVLLEREVLMGIDI